MNNAIGDAGAVYVFTNGSTGTWVQVNKLVASDRSLWANFGFSLAISGNTMMSGVPSDSYDETGGNPIQAAGSVYYFEDTSNVTSVQNLGNLIELQVYPNPATDHLVVRSEEDGRANIYDNSGRLVGSWVIQAGDNTIHLADEVPGMYIFEYYSRQISWKCKLILE